MSHRMRACLWLLVATGTLVRPATALPTMIRLGYTNCAACHISPQGGGLLNDYGRGIDQAQSLRAGEYRPSENELAQALTWGGRITQDLRAVFQEQTTWATGSDTVQVFRPRVMYRNATEVGAGFRVAAVATLEGESAPRPQRIYEPQTAPSTFFVNTAMLHWRASKNVELAAGRDQLPTGVNIPDLAPYVRSRNRLGYYDAPTQAKLFWWGKRHQVIPFVYAPGGNEPSGEREWGGGALAEVDVLGNHRTILGTSFQRGTAANGDRTVAGGYARLGFGQWGVLAEHDATFRSRDALPTGTFRQDASYGQVFWAVREWLVAYATGERLRVEAPFRQRLNAAKLELAARLASQATVIVGARLERDDITGRQSKSLVVQAAVKTVP